MPVPYLFPTPTFLPGRTNSRTATLLWEAPLLRGRRGRKGGRRSGGRGRGRQGERRGLYSVDTPCILPQAGVVWRLLCLHTHLYSHYDYFYVSPYFLTVWQAWCGSIHLSIPPHVLKPSSYIFSPFYVRRPSIILDIHTIIPQAYFLLPRGNYATEKFIPLLLEEAILLSCDSERGREVGRTDMTWGLYSEHCIHFLPCPLSTHLLAFCCVVGAEICCLCP